MRIANVLIAGDCGNIATPKIEFNTTEDLIEKIEQMMEDEELEGDVEISNYQDFAYDEIDYLMSKNIIL